jgi:CHASE3 domain sensor protein
MDVLLEELDRKEEELAEVKMENEACLEYETMVEEMAQEILKKEDDVMELEKKVKSMEEILSIQEGYSENLEQYN